MDFIAQVFAFVALLGVFTYFVIPKGWHRGLATLLFVAMVGGAFAMSFEAAGQPKPVEIEWRKMTELPVVAFVPDEATHTVYLWIIRDGVPVSYAYPWPSNKRVEELQDAWRQKDDTGDEFYIVDDGSKIAEMRTQPALPPKEVTP